MEALSRGRPVSLTAFRSEALVDYVHDVLATRPIDTIYVFSGQMGQYVPADFSGRLLLDLVDVDSAKFEQYAVKGFGPRRWIDAREGRLLRAVEDRLSVRAEHTLLVSEAEADLFRLRVSDAEEHSIRALGNGIDADYFDPEASHAHAELASKPGPHIVFTGQMDYAPNVEAAHKLLGTILPAIRQVHPDATAHIVGRKPAPALRQYGPAKGAIVWGEVADMRPFLAGADLVCVPLALARGIQNKVLEAMAMARPVIASQSAATGIGAEDSKHLAIAEGTEAFVARALELLAHRDMARDMGRAARAFVVDHRSWPAMLAQLPLLAGRGAAGVRLVSGGPTGETRHVA